MIKKIIKLVFLFVIVFIGFSALFVYREIHSVLAGENKITFEIKEGESVNAIIEKLKAQKVISSDFLLKQYLKFTGADTKIKAGLFEIEPPITIQKIVAAIQGEGKSNEQNITIIPGWNLRDMAKYFEAEGIASSTKVYALTGQPGEFGPWASSTFQAYAFLKTKPQNVSLEGYLAPETYRIYKNEKIDSVLKRLLEQREKDFTTEMLQEIQKQGKTVHEILTMASILEQEVKTPEDRKKVADLFWRRIQIGMGLQADSTVHYLSGREGDVFTKQKERDVDSLYNTYKYRDLPPGPIANPSVSSIMAAIYPTPNDAFYFLTTTEGDVKYARTLDEHNANVVKYLR